MANYFRITAYHTELDSSIIMDAYGLFDKVWQFSSELVKKGFKILEVGNDEKFLDANFEKVDEISDKFMLRANMKGKPLASTYKVGNTEYQAVIVGDKIYIPDKEKTV